MPDLNVSLILRMVDRLSGPLGGAVKGVSDAGRVTAATQAKLTKLGETEKAIGGFVRLKAETSDTAAKLQAAQAKVAGIAREMRGVETPTKAMTNAFQAAKREAATLKTAHGELQIKTETARRSLTAMGVSTRNLGSEQRRLKAEIDATTHAAEREAKAGERMARIRGMVGGTGGMGGGLAGVAGTAGAGLGAKASINAAGDFEFQLAQMAVTADASMDMLGEWRLKLLGVARDTVQARDKVAEGASVMFAAGLSQDKIFAALPGIGRTATAETADFLDLSNSVVTLIQNLGILPEKAGRGLEIMSIAGKAGNFELKAMSKYFPMLTAQASTLGLKGEKGIASIAAALQVARMGAGDEAEAANNMANFLKATTTGETAKNFQKHGINLKKSLMNGVKKGEDPLEVMLKLIGKVTGADITKEMDRTVAEKVAAGMNPDAAAKAAAAAIGEKFKLGELFNDSQVMNFLGPMLAHFQEFKKIKEDALSGKGVVDTDFDKMMATWEKQTQRATGAVSGLSEAVGHALIPVLLPMVKGVADGAVALTNLADAYPQVTAGVVGLAGGFLALRTTLGVFRLISGVAGVVGMLPGPLGAAARVLPMFGGGLKIAGAALSFVATGIRVVGVALLANPIGLIIAGVAALIAGAAYLIYDNWGTIGPWLDRQWDAISGTVSSGIAWVSSLVSGWHPLDTFSTAWTGVTGFIGDVWTGAVAVASSGVASVTGVVSGWHPLDAVSTAWNGVTGFIGDVWTGAGAAASSGVASVTGVVSGWHPLDAVSTAWNGVTGYFTGLWADITGIAGKALDWIDQKIQSAIGWITGIRDKIGSTVDWVASSLGLSGSPDKPTVAGVAPPRPANLNAPPAANDARPSRLPAVAAAGAGPATYTLALTFTLNGVISDAEVGRMIDRAKDDLERKFASMVQGAEARRAALHD